MKSPIAFRRIAAIVLALYSLAMLAGTFSHDEALPKAGCSAEGELAWVELCDTDCPRDHEHHRHPSGDHRHDCVVCRGMFAPAIGAQAGQIAADIAASGFVAPAPVRFPASIRHDHPPARGPPAAL